MCFMGERSEEEALSQHRGGFEINGHRFDGTHLTININSYPGRLVARMFGYIIYSQGYVTEAEMLLGEEQARRSKREA